MNFQRWPVNEPMLKDNKPLPVWQRWLSSVVAQLINGVFQTLRISGPPVADDGSQALLTVGDPSNFQWTPGVAFASISGGPGSDVALFVGADINTALIIEGYPGGAIINGGEGGIAPIEIAGSTVFIHGQNGVGIGIDPPTAILTVGAGSATAGAAPLKFTPGALLTTPELGAMEFVDNGTTGHLYITQNVAGVLTRVQIV